MRVPEEIVDRLKEKGLVVSKPFPKEQFIYAEGVKIGKPSSAGGNSSSTWSSEWGDAPGTFLNAPILFLYFDEPHWIVSSEGSEGGPAYFQLRNEWLTAEEALQDIIDFYFGDPKRMNAMR